MCHRPQPSAPVCVRPRTAPQRARRRLDPYRKPGRPTAATSACNHYDVQAVWLVDFDAALQSLEAEALQLLLLVVVDGYSQTEAAAILGISVRSVSYKLPNALRTLEHRPRTKEHAMSQLDSQHTGTQSRMAILGRAIADATQAGRDAAQWIAEAALLRETEYQLVDRSTQSQPSPGRSATLSYRAGRRAAHRPARPAPPVRIVSVRPPCRCCRRPPGDAQRYKRL